MKHFIEGEEPRQGVLLPKYLDDYVSEENPVRVINVFVSELDQGALGSSGGVPEPTGRPAYHPGVLLKIYVYGYINKIASSRRLVREPRLQGNAPTQHVQLMWQNDDLGFKPRPPLERPDQNVNEQRRKVDHRRSA